MISLAESKDNKKSKIIKNNGDLTIIEYYFPRELFNNDLPQMKLNIKRILKNEFRSSDIFIMSTPAVFFNPIFLKTLELLKNKSIKIIAFDDLLPNKETGTKKYLVDQYIGILKNFEIYAVSEKIRKKLSILIKRKVSYFPNLFDLKDIKTDSNVSKREYITMVNTHPIKGVEIFNALAEKMPNEKFMIVECWADVPKYKIKSSNVKHQQFTFHMKNIYARTKLLLVPSLCEECPARVVTEAAFNGIPIIANKIGSISENKQMVQLVRPPKIKGYILAQSVLSPVVDQHELDQCVERYIEKILEVTSEQNYVILSRIARNKAVENIKLSEKLFNKIVSRW